MLGRSLRSGLRQLPEDGKRCPICHERIHLSEFDEHLAREIAGLDGLSYPSQPVEEYDTSSYALL